MYQVFADVFSRQVSETLSKMPGLHIEACKLEEVKGDPPALEKGPVIKVDFKSEVFGEAPLTGSLYLNSENSAADYLAGFVAAYLGFENKQTLTTDALLSELLNIIVGHTAGQWNEYGFFVEFSPPELVTTLSEIPKNSQIFTITSSKLNTLNFIAVFPNRQFRAGVGCGG